MRIRIRKAALTAVVVALSFTAFAAENVKEAVFEAAPGEEWQLDWTWHRVEVPLTAYVRPYVTAWNAEGKQVYAQNVGRIQQRAFGPHDFGIEQWRIYARIAEEGDAANSGFLITLAKITLPSTTRKVRLSITVSRDEAKFDRVTMGVTKLSVPPPRTPYGMQAEFPVMTEKQEDLLSDAELDGILAKRKKLVPKLVSAGDRTDLYVNGKQVVPKIYKTAARACKSRLPSVTTYSKKGFNIFTIGFSLGPSTKEIALSSSGIWKADGSVDTEKVRFEIREYLRRFPDGMFMLTFVVKPRAGWAEENPDEIMRNEQGKFGIFRSVRICDFRDTLTHDLSKDEYPAFSYTSAKFGDDVSVVFEKLFAELERWPEGKAVIGVYVCGGTDGQWLDVFDNHVPGRQAADYAECSKRGFAEFRRRKYGGESDSRIPTAEEFWDRTKPHYAEHASTLFSDWREFYARATTEMRLKFARAIKQGSNGRILVGSYSPNAGLAGYPLIAQTYAKGLLLSPDYDFFAVVPSYVREHVDPVNSAVFDGSMIRRGKLYISELDLRSGDVSNWGFWGSEFWRSTHNASTFRRKALYFVANSLVHGGGYHVYDMDGGWFATDAAQETWRVANEMADAAKALKPAPETLAMVSGERYWDFHSMGKDRVVPYLLREQPMDALARCGAPWNAHLVDELLEMKDAELPKVVLFTDLTTITYAEFTELKRRYAKDNRVIVWFWRPGIFSVDGMKIEEELGLKPAPEAYRKLGFAAGDSTDPLMKGVKGTLMPTYPYYNVEFAAVSKPDTGAGWKTLAPFKGTDVPALAVRRGAACTEIYTAMPGGITPQLCRNFLREAKLKPLIESHEISGYGSGIFYILAQSDGVKRFRLPDGVKPGKVLTGASYKDGKDGLYEVRMKRADIFVLEVNPVK
ncbi:MAG: hypothetical protein WC340_06520 [Kiritimatiellia bacterium]